MNRLEEAKRSYLPFYAIDKTPFITGQIMGTDGRKDDIRGVDFHLDLKLFSCSGVYPTIYSQIRIIDV